MKTASKILMKIAIFLIKWSIILTFNYCRYAIKGLIKVLFNPKHAIIALPICLISALDAKFFVGYTFGGAEYAPIIHLVIILAPFAYFYFLGKVDIVIVPEEQKIKIEKPSRTKKKISEIINQPIKSKDKNLKPPKKKESRKTINKIETLSGFGTTGFTERVKNIKARRRAKQ